MANSYCVEYRDEPHRQTGNDCTTVLQHIKQQKFLKTIETCRNQKTESRNLQDRGHHDPHAREVAEGGETRVAAVGDAREARIVVPRAAAQHATAFSNAVFPSVLLSIRIRLIEAMRPFPHIAAHIECSA